MQCFQKVIVSALPRLVGECKIKLVKMITAFSIREKKSDDRLKCINVESSVNVYD
jgi:hypothetical protein